MSFARSVDGGASFSEPIVLDGKSTAGAVPWGRVDVVTLDDGRSVVRWVARGGAAEGQLALAWIEGDGPLWRERMTVPGPEPARQIGFPQMVLDGEDLILAWTAAEGENSHRVHTVRITENR
ncbi:hypothetical protein [Lentisalinibacter sediminis]|uniref:hypothetical protein n=1 Tax=Lentisalinibacter sediminis TaxID=2992237 RepID=UPI003866F025